MGIREFDDEHPVLAPIVIGGTIVGMVSAVVVPLSICDGNKQEVVSFEIERSAEFDARMSAKLGEKLLVERVVVVKEDNKNYLRLVCKRAVDIDDPLFASYEIDDEAYSNIVSAKKAIESLNPGLKKDEVSKSKKAVEAYYDLLYDTVVHSGGYIASIPEK